MTYSDEVLSAFLDGEADPTLTAEIETAMSHDPALAARMERLGSKDRLLREAFDDMLGEPPARLRAALGQGAEAAAERARSAEILAFKPRPKPSPAAAANWPRLAAASVAALMIGAAITLVALPRTRAPIAEPADGLAPGASLAAALAKTPSGIPAPVGGEVLTVALSFRSRDGSLCRQFHLGTDKSAAEGVACHTGRGWRIEGWMAGRSQAAGGYQTAGGEDAISAAMVDRLGVARTLDGAGEIAAIKAGWR